MDEYFAAQNAQVQARLRQSVTLRAMLASEGSQRKLAKKLGISQSAISQRLDAKTKPTPQQVMAACGDIARRVAEDMGFTKIAIFGSVARGQSRADSDIDFLVQPPEGASIKTLLTLQSRLASILGCDVDVATYDGLTAGLDDDILQDKVML